VAATEREQFGILANRIRDEFPDLDIAAEAVRGDPTRVSRVVRRRHPAAGGRQQRAGRRTRDGLPLGEPAPAAPHPMPDCDRARDRRTSTGDPSGSTNSITDYHVIYAVGAIVLAATYAGRTWGLGRAWGRLPFVQKHPRLS
jgi:hypothetical protein